ncbi:hypothetical protein HZH68_010111 [Vespula germanica]|uniref:Uncharacterized protein n=1 Tax=Vespula germanica TaxID=30212 RepID=A0A834K2I9_VESGE|nr:hypothetical protein HZH68_010111 [Vespula germanica]
MARCTALPANEKVRRGGSERRVEVVPCSLLLLLSRCSVPGGGVVVAAGAAAGTAAGAAGAGAAATAVANREFNLETTQTSTLRRSLSFFSSII